MVTNELISSEPNEETCCNIQIACYWCWQVLNVFLTGSMAFVDNTLFLCAST
jgi:hypothetical protein